MLSCFADGTDLQKGFLRVLILKGKCITEITCINSISIYLVDTKAFFSCCVHLETQPRALTKYCRALEKLQEGFLGSL